MIAADKEQTMLGKMFIHGLISTVLVAAAAGLYAAMVA